MFAGYKQQIGDFNKKYISMVKETLSYSGVIHIYMKMGCASTKQKNKDKLKKEPQ